MVVEGTIGGGGGWDRLRDKLNAVIVRLYLLVLTGHCSDDVHQLGAGLQAVPGQGGQVPPDTTQWSALLRGDPGLGPVQVHILPFLVRYQQLLDSYIVPPHINTEQYIIS